MGAGRWIPGRGSGGSVPGPWQRHLAGSAAASGSVKRSAPLSASSRSSPSGACSSALAGADGASSSAVADGGAAKDGGGARPPEPGALTALRALAALTTARDALPEHCAAPGAAPANWADSMSRQKLAPQTPSSQQRHSKCGREDRSPSAGFQFAVWSAQPMRHPDEGWPAAPLAAPPVGDSAAVSEHWALAECYTAAREHDDLKMEYENWAERAPGRAEADGSMRRGGRAARLMQAVISV